MALFESRATRQAKRQVVIRMAKKKVERYVSDCRSQAEKYRNMAAQAIRIDDEAGCDRYLFSQLQYARHADKWAAFLLRMEDLSMRGGMAGAIQGLIGGIEALTKEIDASVSLRSMGTVVADFNAASTRLGQAEELLTGFMEQLDLEIGCPAESGPAVRIPPEAQESVNAMREELTREIALRESVSAMGRLRGGRSAEVDARILQGRERLRNLQTR